jgi:predicted Fe-Mo cluster-binding NifX family protein
MKHGVIRQFLKDVAWGKLDYLVVDSPPGTGDEPLSVAQLIGSPVGAIVVTTPQDVAIADVRRCIGFCRSLSLSVIGIVENMSGFVCPRCGERVDLFKRGGGMALAREMDVPFLGQIPVDPEVVTAGDAGLALLRGGPLSAASKAFSVVVDEILAGVSRRHGENAGKGDQGKSRLRIVIPLAAGELSPRFGGCAELALFEVDRQAKQIINKSVHKAPKHLPGVLPRRLHELGVDVVLANEMGDKARKLLEGQGMHVVLGVPPKPVNELVLDYLNEFAAKGRPVAVQ